MTPIKSYRLLLTPLSPIHIGTGESFEPTHYVIEDEVLFEFDTSAVVGAINDADRKKLLEIGSRRPDHTMIQAVQRFFFERRAPLMAHAVHRVPVLPGVANLYASRVGQVANREAGGGTVLNRLEIDRTAFEPARRKPVLYGSSLKGAIRTALLDGVNRGQSLRLVTDPRTGKSRRENNQELQQRLFQFRAGRFELDPMHLIQLADAPWRGPENLPPTQVRFAVNRKRAPVVDERGVLRKSQAEDLYQILECVSPGLYRGFVGQLNLQSLAALANQFANRLPASDLRFDITQIARACNAFYRPILEDELHKMQARGFVDEAWVNGIQHLLHTSHARLERGEVFLLRVGRHSGAESVTLNGVRSIAIKRKQGQPPEFLDSTKTWWLAALDIDQMQGLLPFGWLIIEVVPDGQDAADWEPLQSLCATLAAPIRDLAQKLQAKESDLARLRAEIETQRQTEEAERRRQEEAAAQRAREEAERQARLATLTPNMRRVEEFIAKAQQRLEQLRGGKERQNTGFHSEAQQLAKTALDSQDWTAEEKRALAEALETWLPRLVERLDQKDDWKDARKKLRLAALKGES